MSSIKRKYTTVTKVTPKKKSKMDAKMAKIAKSVVLRQAETISPINNFEFSPNYNELATRNLNYFVSQGDTSYQIHGEKVMLKNIHMKVRLFWNGGISVGVTVGNSDRIIRVLVYKTKTPLTSSYGSSITKSEVFRQESGTTSTLLATTGHVDLRKVTLLYDKSITFRARDMITTANVSGMLKDLDINIPLNKVEYFDGDTSGYFKTGNYYFSVIYDDTIASSLAGFTVSCQYAMNVKDL